MTIRHYILLMTTLTVMLTGCHHKGLYVENYTLYQARIDFDFSQVEQVPAAMRVLFYPTGELAWHEPYTYDLTAQGGVVSLPAGSYRVLAYNADARNIVEAGEQDYTAFSLTTPSYEVTLAETEDRQGNKAVRRKLFGSSVPIAEDERPDYLLYDSPEWTCCCRADHFHVDPVYEQYVGTYDGTAHDAASQVVNSRLTLLAEKAVRTLEFEVSGIEGVEWAKLIRGTISGVPAAHRMAGNTPSGEVGMMTFAAHMDTEQQKIVGSMNVWGFCPSDRTDVQQFIDIYLWTNAGNYFLTQNVTDQMRSGQDNDRQRLVLQLTSSLNIMDAAEGDSGFKPSVGEWDEVSTGIQL